LCIGGGGGGELAGSQEDPGFVCRELPGSFARFHILAILAGKGREIGFVRKKHFFRKWLRAGVCRRGG